MHVIRVNDWASADKQAFDAAMSQNMKPVSDLQAALAANTAVNTAAGEQQVMPGKVVASQISSMGRWLSTSMMAVEQA